MVGRLTVVERPGPVLAEEQQEDVSGQLAVQGITRVHEAELGDEGHRLTGCGHRPRPTPFSVWYAAQLRQVRLGWGAAGPEEQIDGDGTAEVVFRCGAG